MSISGAANRLANAHGFPVFFQEMTMLQNSPMYAYIPAKDISRARGTV
jgi:hypothetical protein